MNAATITLTGAQQVSPASHYGRPLPIAESPLGQSQPTSGVFDYDAFLEPRRKLMVVKVQSYFQTL